MHSPSHCLDLLMYPEQRFDKLTPSALWYHGESDACRHTDTEAEANTFFLHAIHWDKQGYFGCTSGNKCVCIKCVLSFCIRRPNPNGKYQSRHLTKQFFQIRRTKLTSDYGHTTLTIIQITTMYRWIIYLKFSIHWSLWYMCRFTNMYSTHTQTLYGHK